MKEVVIILVGILAIVGALVWVYYNYISISDSRARKIEILGYVLLIVLIIWEYAIKNIALGEFYDIEWYYLSEKLKFIYLGIESILEEGALNTASAREVLWHKSSSDLELQKQLLAVDVVEVILQVMSTVFIAIGRFQELKGKKSSSEVLEK